MNTMLEKYGRVLLVTLGHVDHGKSTLIKTLTGIDPDRLPEEKILQGTTDLGFAFFQANNGKFYGFIDVPGHRDYIKNLIIGVLHANFYILVVDAQEGVMPQTIEHLELIQALQLKYGIAVISKIDLVNSERVKEVEEQIKLFYNEYEVNPVPIVAVSFYTGAGVEELKNKLTECLEKTPPYINDGAFVLPVMRAFSVPGRGTVVTGPVIKGCVKVGETVYNDSKKSIVREINIYKNHSDTAFTGVTAALNVPDFEVEDVRRGTAILGGEVTEWSCSRKTLVLLKHTKKLKKYLEKKIISCIAFILTYNAPAKIIILKNFENFSLAYLVFEEDKSMYTGLTIVCYSKDMKEFLCCGEVLYTNLEGNYDTFNYRLFIKKFLQDFDYNAYKENRLLYLLKCISSERNSIDLEALEYYLNTTDYKNIIKTSSSFMLSSNLLINLDYMFAKISNILDEFHKKNPTLYGLKIKELSENLQLSPTIVKEIMQIMQNKSLVNEFKDFYFLPTFKVQQDTSILPAIEKLKSFILQNPFITYSKSELIKAFNDDKKIELAFEKLKADGEMVHLGENRWIHIEGLEKIKSILQANKNRFGGGFSPKDLKPLIGDLSRKHLIPILEYLDKTGVTKWKGNLRYII